MHSGQLRSLQIGLAVGVVVLSGAAFAYFRYFNDRRVEALVGSREGGGGGATRSGRLEQLQQLRAKTPSAAVTLAEEIMAKPGSDAERNGARAEYPDLLAFAMATELRAGRMPEAAALRDKLLKRLPASPQAAGARLEWGRQLGLTAEAAWRKGDEPAAEAALAELFQAPGFMGNASAFRNWVQFHEGRWRELAPTNPGEAMRHLATAARTIATGEQFRTLAYAIQGSAAVKDAALAAEADRWAASPQRHAALVLWWGQWLRLQSGRTAPGEAKLSDADRRAAIAAVGRKLTTGLGELGDRLRAGDRPAFVAVEPRVLYQTATELLRDQPEELPALAKLIECDTAEVEKLAQPVVSVELGALFTLSAEQQTALIETAREVRRRTERIFSDPGLRLWDRVVQRPNFNPWPLVPPAWAERIEAKAPEPERRRQLGLLFAQEPARIPLTQLTSAAALHFGSLARAGLLATALGLSEADDALRLVLRGTDSPELRAGLVAVLRQRIVDLAAQRRFDPIYSLAGLYISEVGLPAVDDPFRGQLRAALVNARDYFRVGLPMKTIFMNALLADGFADEEVGQKARQEAQELAFAQFAGPAPQAGRGGTVPSGVPGLSFARIENSTSHHLLIFYRGPEQVMLHSSPYKRGTASLLSGEYEVAVLCPDGAIQPYRGRVILRDALHHSAYRIDTGPNRGLPPANLSGGAYTWLRRGPGAEKLLLSAHNGVATAPSK